MKIKHCATPLVAGFIAVLVLNGTAAAQSPAVAMSAPWAQAMCGAWNADPGLTSNLVESGWAKNDGGRGHKAMQIYRADCPKAERIELQIAVKDNKAQCVYGGVGAGLNLSSFRRSERACFS